MSLLGGLPVEAQDSGKEAIICCYSSHCNTGGRSLHQGIQGYISTFGRTFSDILVNIRSEINNSFRGHLLFMIDKMHGCVFLSSLLEFLQSNPFKGGHESCKISSNDRKYQQPLDITKLQSI